MILSDCAAVNKRIQMARWISIIGHPFTFVVLLVSTASWNLHGSHRAIRTTCIVIGAVLIPLGLFIWNRYSTGRWQTVDASAPEDRPALYTVSFALLIPLGFYFLYGERAAEMMRGFAAVAILIGVAAALNRWIKLSAHLTMATFAAVIITRLVPNFGWALIAFLPTLGWSRLILSRHSISEVIGGFLLGLAVASFTLWL
jgi:hypothetical protein